MQRKCESNILKPTRKTVTVLEIEIMKEKNSFVSKCNIERNFQKNKQCKSVLASPPTFQS